MSVTEFKQYAWHGGAPGHAGVASCLVRLGTDPDPLR